MQIKSMNNKMNVALIYDLEDWILGSIARSMKEHIEIASDVRYQLYQSPRTVKQFRSILNICDAVHFLSPWNFFQFSSFSYKPTIVTIHHLGEDAKKQLHLKAQQIDAICFTNTQCEEMLRELSYINHSLMYSTPYGLDTNKFKPVSAGRDKMLSLTNCQPDTIFIGMAAKKTSNEENRKSFDRYFILMETLLERFKDKIELIVFGPGSESQHGWSYEDFPESIRNHVILPGFISSDELPLFYSGVDYYVCLSRLEGGPYPVMECMSCEVTVISTEVGVVRNLIQDAKNGYIVDGNNYLYRIPEIIDLLSKNRQLAECVRQRAREDVLLLHSWDNVAKHEHYSAMYGDAINNWKRRSKTSILRKYRDAHIFPLLSQLKNLFK